MKRKRRYPGLRETKGKWKYRFMVDHVTYARVTGLEATAVNAMAALRQRERAPADGNPREAGSETGTV